jgi:uncharacterized protein
MSNSASRKRASTQRRRQIQDKALHMDDTCPRFVADVMLGRLAKWLRIAGFDVLYSNRYTDEELITLSRQEARILLSRDTRLLIRRNVKHFIYLESEKVQDQIRQIFQTTHTASLPDLLTRCLECNDRLQEVSREEVRGVVPPFVFKTQPSFKSCPSCHKIYWAGTHRQSVLRTLKSLL